MREFEDEERLKIAMMAAIHQAGVPRIHFRRTEGNMMAVLYDP